MNDPNNITVDRGELQVLIDYASGEIDTRMSCLKDAGSDRKELETEISEGQETLATFRALLEMDVRPKTTELRNPYYLVSDGVSGLQTALNDPNLRKDSGLLYKITQLTEALEALRQYMDDKYIWD